MSLEVTITLESTATAGPLTLAKLEWPDGVTTGAAMNTFTCSGAEMLASAPSMATTEIDRAAVFGVVVENVTDCRAAWYWAGVALPLKVSTPPDYTLLIPLWLVKLRVSPDCNVLAEIVTVAPVSSVWSIDTVAAGSTETAEAPAT